MADPLPLSKNLNANALSCGGPQAPCEACDPDSCPFWAIHDDDISEIFCVEYDHEDPHHCALFTGVELWVYWQFGQWLPCYKLDCAAGSPYNNIECPVAWVLPTREPLSSSLEVSRHEDHSHH